MGEGVQGTGKRAKAPEAAGKRGSAQESAPEAQESGRNLETFRSVKCAKKG